MALSSCMVDGVIYTISGGKIVVDGTAYELRQAGNRRSGIAVVGGTAYDIYLPPYDIAELGRARSSLIYSGYNSSSPGKTSVSLSTAGTYFVFSIYNGYAGLYMIESSGSALSTPEMIIRNSTNANVYCTGTTVYHAASGATAGTNRYGSTVIAMTFDAPSDLVIKTFQQYSFTRLAGRNSATAGTVSCASDAWYSAIGDWWIECTGEYFCMRMVTGIGSSSSYATGLAAHMPSGMSNTMHRNVSGTSYLTLDDSTNASVNGGSMISVRRTT